MKKSIITAIFIAFLSQGFTFTTHARETVSGHLAQPTSSDPVNDAPCLESNMTDTDLSVSEPTKEIGSPLRVSSVSYPFVLKTNLLYWGGVMPDLKHYSVLPNLGLEWFITPRWSVSGYGAYANWKVGSDKHFGVSAWAIESRYRITPLQNIHLYTGIYGQIGDFDNQNIHIDDYGHTGTFFSAGLSFGVVIPFNERWGAEIGLRGGFLRQKIDVYSPGEPADFYDYSKTKNRWRITDTNLSITYRFGHKTNK